MKIFHEHAKEKKIHCYWIIVVKIYFEAKSMSKHVEGHFVMTISLIYNYGIFLNVMLHIN